jgi:hypothetical protein
MIDTFSTIVAFAHAQLAQLARGTRGRRTARHVRAARRLARVMLYRFRMHDKTPHNTKQPKQPKHVENSTDATRGEPLAARAQTRKAELEAVLAKLPADEKRERGDIEIALSSLNGLLTGDVNHLTDATAAELNRLLEGSKHLGEVVKTPKHRT